MPDRDSLAVQQLGSEEGFRRRALCVNVDTLSIVGEGRGHGGNIKQPNACGGRSASDTMTVPARHNVAGPPRVLGSGPLSKWWSPRLGSAAVALGSLCLTACAARGPASLTPKVVWVTGERAYVASRDSTALAPDDSVSFELRGKTIAIGTVSSVGQGEMATVAISSGSLAGERNFGRLRVVISRPLVKAPSLLRIGYPAARRSAPFFACPEVGILKRGYRSERLGEQGYRMVRDPSVALDAAWADTLEVRLFSEAVDEEIALESGRLDIAIFWPGELSPSMRDNPRWHGFSTGVWKWGLVALSWGIGDAPESGDELDAFDSLNRDLFRGDLVPLWGSVRGRAAADSLPAVRVDEYPPFPERAKIQRYLDRRGKGWSPRGPAPPARAARLFYLGPANAAWDSLGHDVVEALRSGVFSPSFRQNLSDHRIVPLFAIHCPVVCAPGLRAHVRAMGPDSLVDPFLCQPSRFR